MLGYAHMNLISMLKRLESEKVVRVASDSLYIQKNALHKLEGVVAYNVKDQKIQAEVPSFSSKRGHVGEKHVLIGRKRDKLGNQTCEVWRVFEEVCLTAVEIQMFGYQACHVCAQLEHVFLPRVHA